MSRSTKQQLLKQAAKVFGREELAAKLNVPVTLLDVWMRGLATIPDRKLLALADVLDDLPLKSGHAPR